MGKTNFELQADIRVLEAEKEAQAAENEELKKALQAVNLLTEELAKMKTALDGTPNTAKVEGPNLTVVESNNIDEWLKEKIPVKFFKDGEQYKDDITTIYRGEAFNIKRGISVMIPRGLALALEDAEQQNQKANSTMEGFEEVYSKAMSRLE